MSIETLRRSYAELLASRSGGSRAACPPSAELARAASREGPEVRRLETLDHAMACPQCRREFELLRSLSAARPHTPPLASATWVIAAMLVLAIGVAIVWRGRVESGKDDVPRGGGGLAVIQPAPSTAASPPVTFAWRPVSGATGYVLAIAEGGEVRLTRETTDTALTLAAELSPGELHWWVEARRQDGTTVASAPVLLRIIP